MAPKHLVASPSLAARPSGLDGPATKPESISQRAGGRWLARRDVIPTARLQPLRSRAGAHVWLTLRPCSGDLEHWRSRPILRPPDSTPPRPITSRPQLTACEPVARLPLLPLPAQTAPCSSRCRPPIWLRCSSQGRECQATAKEIRPLVITAACPGWNETLTINPLLRRWIQAHPRAPLPAANPAHLFPACAASRLCCVARNFQRRCLRLGRGGIWTGFTCVPISRASPHPFSAAAAMNTPSPCLDQRAAAH